VLVFDDSGHWPHIDNPHRAADETAKFIERQMTRTARTPTGGGLGCLPAL
jgi:hypothetical protein